MPIPTSRIPGLLEHLGFDTGMQGKCGRHPANPATDNQDLHRFAFKNAVSEGGSLGVWVHIAPGDDQSATRKPSGSKANVGDRCRRQRANSRLFCWTNFPARLVHVACDE